MVSRLACRRGRQTHGPLIARTPRTGGAAGTGGPRVGAAAWLVDCGGTVVREGAEERGRLLLVVLVVESTVKRLSMSDSFLHLA